jgi:hypothetical protein
MAYRLYGATHQLKSYKEILTLRHLDICIAIFLKTIPITRYSRLRCYANDQLRRGITKGMGEGMEEYQRESRTELR